MNVQDIVSLRPGKPVFPNNSCGRQAALAYAEAALLGERFKECLPDISQGVSGAFGAAAISASDSPYATQIRQLCSEAQLLLNSVDLDGAFRERLTGVPFDERTEKVLGDLDRSRDQIIALGGEFPSILDAFNEQIRDPIGELGESRSKSPPLDTFGWSRLDEERIVEAGKLGIRGALESLATNVTSFATEMVESGGRETNFGKAQTKKNGGRSPTPVWKKIFPKMREWLVENGVPARGDGEQAKLEEQVQEWVEGMGKSFAESTIRAHVRNAINQRREELSIPNGSNALS